MKTTIRIAKIELSTLFYSPIAWLLMIVFFIQNALSYTDYMQNWVTLQELGGPYKQNMIFLTSSIFAYPSGMAPTIIYNLYLYMPLLTMGLISREISSGTIKLLYSSPVKTGEIITGKFLAIVAYGLLLTLIFSIFLTAGMFQLQNADTGLLLSVSAGMFILLCTYGAIGLFVSCLTSYQVVAAISTFVLFAFLSYLGNLWQDIDFVRDLTYSMSISGRVNKMGSGLFTTKDLCYFGIIITTFLALSVLKLQGTRSSDSGLKKTLKYTAVIICALVIGYITARPTMIGYVDTTATKTQTLTKTTQKILKDMDKGPLEITSYINLLDNFYWQGVPAARNMDVERWEPYIRFKPDIKMKYVYYYDSIPNRDYYKQYEGKTLKEIANIYVKSFRVDIGDFKSPEEMRKIIDLRPEQNRYVMHLKYNGKSTFLRLFDDPLVFPTERETSAALKRMITKLPKIAFLEGELERSPYKDGDRDYKVMTSQITFRYSMVNQGFDFMTVSLKDNDIPADVSALVIADPKAPFEPVVLEKIQRFIDGGGNLLIAGEPGKQQVMNPLLQKLGVRMMDGLLVQKSKDFSPSLAFTYLTSSTAAFSKTMKKVFRDSGIISTQHSAVLQFDSGAKYKVQPLLMTDERNAWLKMGPLSSDSLQVSYTPSEGDEKGKFVTMAGLTRQLPNGKQQRIIVSADADFMSTAELSRYNPMTYNFYLNTDLFGWLSNGEFPVDVTRPDSKDKYIHVKGSQINLLKIIFIGVFPFILFIIGSILLVRRKRK